MQAVDVSRRGIKRNCSGEELTTQRKMFPSYISSVFGNERGLFGTYPEPQLGISFGMGNSSGGEAPEWGSSSTCSCQLERSDIDQEIRLFRLHIPEAWQLQSVKISEGICPVCNKSRGIRQLQHRPCSVFVQGQQGEGWRYNCEDASRAQTSGRNLSIEPRLLSGQQEEDRGARRVDFEEELTTTEELVPYSDDELFQGTGQEDIYLAQQQSISEPTIWNQGPVYPWENVSWEDYTPIESDVLLSDLFDPNF